MKNTDKIEEKSTTSGYITRQRYKRNCENNTRNLTSTCTTSSRARRKRCKQCYTCQEPDCGKCYHCIDMVKFGGKGIAKQSCVKRLCVRPMFSVNTICGICSLDGWATQTILSIQHQLIDTPSNLMECSVCYEIVHPNCLLKQQLFVNKGTYNNDLPNSWICPGCQDFKKDAHSKPRYFPGRKIFNKILKPEEIKEELIKPEEIKEELLTPEEIKEEILSSKKIKKEILTPDEIKEEIFMPDEIKEEILMPDEIKEEIKEESDEHSASVI